MKGHLYKHACVAWYMSECGHTCVHVGECMCTWICVYFTGLMAMHNNVTQLLEAFTSVYSYYIFCYLILAYIAHDYEI